MPSPDTRTVRAAILGLLRVSAPAVPLPVPDLLPYLEGPHGRGSQGPRVDPSVLMAPFEAAARSWRAEVLHASPALWPQVVRQALDQRGCRRVAIGAASPLQPGLDEALAGIAAYLPLVLVESLEVYPARAARGQGESEQQLLTANIQVLSLRAAQ